MPAAAVIPAPVAYIKVVAVETLVVGLLPFSRNSPITLLTLMGWRVYDGRSP